jgi:hypothetical protein
MRFSWSTCAAVAALACSTTEVDGGSVGGSGGAGGAVDCATACAQDHPDGSVLFEALAFCLLCTECFTACNGEESGCMAPAEPGICDAQAVCQDSDDDPTDDCASCALAGSCKEAFDACKASSDCVGFAQCLEPCG